MCAIITSVLKKIPKFFKLTKAKTKMTQKFQIDKILSELEKGMSLEKCRKCGCMKETLESLLSISKSVPDFGNLIENLEMWLGQMGEVKYECLGCRHCYPSVAMNVFNQIFPESSSFESGSCVFETKEKIWPSVPGEYFAFCDGANCPVAVSTLASVELAESLAKIRPKELCIVGKTETENIGIEKVIKNTITNPTIHVLLLVGKEAEGHRSGASLIALWENGIDENMRIINSPGKRPILKNVTLQEVETFRKQVKVVDMISCEDVNKILEKIKEVSEEVTKSCCENFEKEKKSIQVSTVPIIKAKKPDKVEMDKAGYFVIIPQMERKLIIVEHYSYDNKLLRIIEGEEAKAIYWTIIKNGWITQLSHAAYLGKELMKAELSIKFGFKYIQDAQ